jgi:hypothetical protein
MSERELQQIHELVTMLRSMGCPLSHETHPTRKRVRFWNEKHTVEMSDWMTLDQARHWSNGYLIGAGHKPRRNRKKP